MDETSGSSAITDDNKLTIQTVGASNVEQMRVSDDGRTWSEGTGWVGFYPDLTYAMSPDPGERTIQVQYRNSSGEVSSIYTRTIDYRPNPDLIEFAEVKEAFVNRGVGQENILIAEGPTARDVDTWHITPETIIFVETTSPTDGDGYGWMIVRDGYVNFGPVLQEDPVEFQVHIALYSSNGELQYKTWKHRWRSFTNSSRFIRVGEFYDLNKGKEENISDYAQRGLDGANAETEFEFSYNDYGNREFRLYSWNALRTFLYYKP